MRGQRCLLSGLFIAVSLASLHSRARATDTTISAPAPMFGQDFSNSGQSSQIGLTTQPQILWKYKLPFGVFTYSPQSLALGADGLLHAPGGYALNSLNGSVVWHTGGGDVALDGSGHLYASEGETVAARDAATGALLWEGVNTSASHGEPVKIGPDGTVYFSSFNGKLYAYTPSGQLKWQGDFGSIQYGEISLIPAIDSQNDVYFAGGNGLRSLDANGQVRWAINSGPLSSSVVMLNSSNQVVWQRNNVVETRNASTGALISSFTTGDQLQAMDSSGNLYFSGTQILKTTPTGQTIWSDPIGYVDWPLVVDAAGDVYCGDQLGDVIGISSSGQTMWEMNLTSSYPDLYNCAPIIGADGNMYVEELADTTIIALARVPEPASFSILVLGAVTAVYARPRRHR